MELQFFLLKNSIKHLDIRCAFATGESLLLTLLGNKTIYLGMLSEFLLILINDILSKLTLNGSFFA